MSGMNEEGVCGIDMEAERRDEEGPSGQVRQRDGEWEEGKGARPGGL